MQLLVDADACPVTDIVIELGKQFGIPVTLITDTSHNMVKDYAKIITVSKGADSADFKLVNLTSPGDVVITQDYGLAAMALSKKATVLNQDGMLYTEYNIDSLLLSRHQSKKARMAGIRTKGPSKRTPQQNQTFRQTLLCILENAQEDVK